ncbi:MAG TPA: HAMP domain-containing sensor histidine kinase [Actinomycetes bacterium]|nr:HAMP domain-containing sensor histidine kinase [Actinomycetes bacterium]
MRRRVLLLVGATTSLVLVAFLVPLAVLVRTVAADRAVQAATSQAQVLSSLVATADPESLALSVQQVDATSASELTVFLPDGRQLGAPAQRTPLVELATRGSSVSAEVPGGREIVFAVGDATGAFGVIRAFVPVAELSRGVARAWLLLALLGVTLLVVSLVVADRLARTLVRSTIRLAEVSHRLAGGDLSARADPGSPAEIGTVARALNHLAGRIEDLLREERETIADLSHRVRTPLTALRLEAEALPDADDATRVGAGVDAVQRAVTQVIDEARRRNTDTGAGCDAAAVVGERVDYWAALAEDTGRELHRDLAAGPLPVAVGREDLAAGLDALLGNVFAHTPDGTAFAVRLQPRAGGGAVLSVDDAGPGTPDSALVARGASSAGSSGLGLDIARRTAERGGGRLRLRSSDLGGLGVTMELPPSLAGP